MAELHDFLSQDHERLDELLRRLLASGIATSPEAFEEFRRGLLRHIAIEERVLFPELRKAKGSTELEKQLHRDHAALAALLVPSPSPKWIEQLATILEAHNPLEEQEGGLYSILESLSEDRLEELMMKVHAVPEVRMAPHVDKPIVYRSIEQLVKEAEEGRERQARNQKPEARRKT
ncbi:MAG: hemerythrin domain-containing protein [Thermoanaerobaculia bacterium]